jgi:uncharacterized protein (UPF0335 family)
MSDLHLATRQQLKAFIERIERLEEEKKALAGDIRDVYLEAKGTGFDVKIMRQVVRLRKQSTAERQEMEAVLETYLSALGMLDGAATPAASGADNDEASSYSEAAE